MQEIQRTINDPVTMEITGSAGLGHHPGFIRARAVLLSSGMNKIYQPTVRPDPNWQRARTRTYWK